MGRHHDIEELGFEIPPEERTPLVEQLLRIIRELRQENRQLREEIERLKGLPPRPDRSPSMLGDDQPPQPEPGRRRKAPQGKRPGSAKRHKTRQLRIDETVVLPPEDLPQGAVRIGKRDYVVQDLVIRSQNVRYRREVYRLPNGTLAVGRLPEHVDGHFGGTLRSYVLYQHYQNHVTQPLILEELRDLGVDISAGQIDRLLHEGHEAFFAESDSLLPAAREVSRHFHTDDTSARHNGQGWHTTVLSNEFFSSFRTTDSKNRINFLKLLCEPWEEYVLSPDALFYMEWQGLSQKSLKRLATEIDEEGWLCDDSASWQERLKACGIVSEEPRRIATEGALFGCLMVRDLYVTQPIISDDAGQFKILGYLHGLCWLHAERNVARVVPLSARQHRILEDVRGQIWKYYQRLKAYRASPTPQKKGRLERDFDRLFVRRTGFVELNEALARIHDKKDELLLVLDYPHLPLENNLAERDLRQWAKQRKISGTRSDLGRRCRDAFFSLKGTCRKLGLSFWRYLEDRLCRLGRLPPLADHIRSAVADSG